MIRDAAFLKNICALASCTGLRSKHLGVLQFGSNAHLLFVNKKESVEYCPERKKCDCVKVDCILFYLDVVAFSIALVYLLLV